jgi:solute:Na+ symporter, SSS family
VPLFESTKSLIDRLQQLNGLSSMPILSAFIVGLLFRNVRALAAISGLVFGVVIYAFHTFVLYNPGQIFPNETVYQHYGLGGLHYIDIMLFVLIASVLVSLGINRFVFGNRAQFVGWRGITTID